MALLELNNVSKGYGPKGPERTEILEDINLSIEEGEFVSIVGYSGSGKTTLISLIAGLIQADEGEVLLKGKSVPAPGPDRALVFQNYSLLPWLFVRGNVGLAVDQVFPGESKEQREERIMKYVKMVNLAPAIDKKPSELSGGMRQRTSLARALSMDPEILLLDEPLGALDALTRATLQGEIEKIWREAKKTVVLITNDVDEGILLADRIIPLSAGPKATLGPAIDVPIERPRDRKELNHNDDYKRIRREVISFLMDSNKAAAEESRLDVKLPDVLPEDLTIVPKPWTPKRPPRRRSDIANKRELEDAA